MSLSYATLIRLAIINSANEMATLSGIYQWIADNFPYYKTAGTGWKVIVKRGLKIRNTFIRKLIHAMLPIDRILFCTICMFYRNGDARLSRTSAYVGTRPMNS